MAAILPEMFTYYEMPVEIIVSTSENLAVDQSISDARNYGYSLFSVESKEKR